MTDKTKEAIAEVLMNASPTDKIEHLTAIICAIVEAERAGEVVIEQGEVDGSGNIGTALRLGLNKLQGKKGRLIFVPEGEK
jgi:hypothetical protein